MKKLTLNQMFHAESFFARGSARQCSPIKLVIEIVVKQHRD